MSEISTEKWVSMEEVANHLDVGKDTIYRWIASKGLPACKIGRQWKFKISQVDEWIEKNSKLGQVE